MPRQIITTANMGASWYELLQEAKQITGYNMSTDLEHYLILTLNNFNPDSHDFSANISIEYLQAIDSQQTEQSSKLRNVGDQCLLINGMFPQISIKRNVSLNYYAVIGRQAYNTLAVARSGARSSDIDKALFQELSVHFIGLSDLMHNMVRIKH